MSSSSSRPSRRELHRLSRSLPHGWVAAWSQRWSRTYYFRKPTPIEPEGRTQWEEPEEEEAVSVEEKEESRREKRRKAEQKERERQEKRDKERQRERERQREKEREREKDREREREAARREKELECEQQDEWERQQQQQVGEGGGSRKRRAGLGYNPSEADPGERTEENGPPRFRIRLVDEPVQQAYPHQQPPAWLPPPPQAGAAIPPPFYPPPHAHQTVAASGWQSTPLQHPVHPAYAQAYPHPQAYAAAAAPPPPPVPAAGLPQSGFVHPSRQFHPAHSHGNAPPPPPPPALPLPPPLFAPPVPGMMPLPPPPPPAPPVPSPPPPSSSRIESSSRSRANVVDPPVLPSSLEAVEFLTKRGGTATNTQWSDSAKYAAVLRSSKVIAINNVYCSKDSSLLDRFLTPHDPLPPAPTRPLAEEPPALILAVSLQTRTAESRTRVKLLRDLCSFPFVCTLCGYCHFLQRRSAFNDLEQHLSQLCISQGLRSAPHMSFLRWGFNQRSLQLPTLADTDPLLPMQATDSDECLISELEREKLSREKSEEVCAKLAEAVKERAAKLVQMKKQLQAAEDGAAIRQFTLLAPEEQHLYTAASASSSSSSSSSSPPASSSPSLLLGQYLVIYDWKGDEEYAIPLNPSRLQQLVQDYERTNGVRIGVGSSGDSGGEGEKQEGSSSSLSAWKSDQLFLRRLWSMLARYDTISGAGYQAALPEASFHLLTRYWGVTHECYASPLNHCLASFGSAFIDTDRFFGSQGSFLDQRPVEGGFEANPPFLEEVMAPMAMHILALLERAAAASSPLCFVVIWPAWDDTPAYDLLMTSRFMRKLIVFEKNDHSYKAGEQHRIPEQGKAYRRSGARSFVFWMQTDAAAEKWPTSIERLAEFKRSFMAYR